MDYQKILAEASSWVKSYIASLPNPNLSFHNDTHTFQVVEAAKKIATYYRLNERDSFIVEVAAYFHDLGYCTGTAEGHESRSADIAEQFLKERNVDTEVISIVKRCIEATRMPQHPENLLEQIVCDADLFHLGYANFDERNKLMRKEAEAIAGHPISKKEWRKKTISLMERHHYHTEYGQLFLNQKKQENLTALKRKDEEEPDGEKVSEKKKEKNGRPSRGIETMFRITSTNNQRLSDMADNKSHILITVNSIILSVVIAMLIRKLDSNEHLILPTIVLLVVSLATMTVAILATRPSIPNITYTAKDVKEKKVNLLFFGNFHKMDLEDYNKGMREVMEDSDYLYGTLIKDVYSQGVVLGRKYRLLRLAYNIFMFGLILSVISFVFIVVWYA